MSHGASDDVAVPFGRIQEITAKYNLTVRDAWCLLPSAMGFLLLSAIMNNRVQCVRL